VAWQHLTPFVALIIVCRADYTAISDFGGYSLFSEVARLAGRDPVHSKFPIGHYPPKTKE
jgi:hypothetical protein